MVTITIYAYYNSVYTGYAPKTISFPFTSFTSYKMSSRSPEKFPPAPQKKALRKSGTQFRLSRRVNRVQVYFNGENVTPRTIPTACFKAAKERKIAESDVQFSGTIATLNRTMIQASKVFANSSYTHVGRTTSAFITFGGVSTLQETASEVITGYVDATSTTSPNIDDMQFPAEIKEFESPRVPMPEFVSLVIQETETEILLDLPSSTVEKDTPEGELAEEDNKTYEYLTEGRGKNRKMVNAIIQTVSVLNKTKFTEAPRVKSNNDHSFVSLWELYDTYYNDYVPANTSLSLTSIEKDTALTKDDIEMIKLSKNERYMDSVCIMQRILANNVFNEQQKRFRGLSDPSPFREGIEYNYRLNFLWTFANGDTKGNIT